MWFSPTQPAGYLELHLRQRISRARSLSDRGASTVEWVIITAILVVIAGAVGTALYTKIKGKADQLNVNVGP